MSTEKGPEYRLLEKAPLRLYVAASGAAAGLQRTLWEVPGISSVLYASEFPYDTEATDRFLGYKPTKVVNGEERGDYCSAKNAIRFAMEAYYRAYKFDGPEAIGVGISASVTSVKEHRGDHRIFGAWFSEQGCQVFGRKLEKIKDPTSRIVDGLAADEVGLFTIFSATGINQDPPPWNNWQVLNGDPLTEEVFWENPVFLSSGKRVSGLAAVEGLFPGAFNPPHEGHFGIAKSFHELTWRRLTFQVTAHSPHKPPLTVVNMLQRAKLLEGYDRMFTKGLPLYLDKAKAYPNTPIILGPDALERILDPKWGIDTLDVAKGFREAGTTLYVPDVRVVDGVRINTSNLNLNEKLPGVPVRILPGEWDYSSSAIRKATERAAQDD